MNKPDYNALLRSFWSSPTLTESVEDNTKNEVEGDITDFLAENILWQETVPYQLPDQQPMPDNLPSELIEALQKNGITQLYSHQLSALLALRKGKDVIITTATASGKTLSAYPAILEGCLNKGYGAISFYSLKALALDQFNKISTLLAGIPEATRPKLAMLTGDIKTEERERLLATNPHIIGATPELIHYQLRASWRSEHWSAFFKKLRYILVDESHLYSSVMGASMALLLRRIKLAVDHHGGTSAKLQFIFLSATVGNPVQLAQRLSGRTRDPNRLVLIDKSGAAASERRLLVLKPSTNANPDAAKIILYLLKQGISGITFCNSRQAVKSLLGLVKTEAIRQGCRGYEDKVAIFYGSLTGDRRAEIIEQIQSGQIRFIISTEALEAGIDLPELDCCIIRGWPGSIMSFRQRIGRSGRARPGLAIFLPVAQSPLDQYFSNYPTLLLSGEAEQVNFNESYPILLAKHLLCACVETGIPTNKLKRYFGPAASKVVTALMQQDQIFKGRKGFWAKGFPHKDVNFRGGSSSGTIKLVDADLSGEEFEEMSEDIAFREVYPGAIYRCQNTDGQMLNFRSVSLDLDSRKAILKRVADSPTFTVAITESKTKVEDQLAAPIQIPLSFSHPELSQDKNCTQSQLQLELAWGKISQLVTGYQLLTKQYELTCLNQRCLKYKEPQPSRRNCSSCGKKTREAEIITVISEVKFEKPYQTQFTTPVVQVSLNNQAREHLRAIAAETKKAITQKAQVIPAGYQQLWEYPISLIALHSFGHQVMAALPLVVLSSRSDINYVVERIGDGGYYGLFYDCSEGGNGASEAVFQNLTKLASTAVQLADSCDCETGCPKCLQQHGCPQGNKGLLKQMGITLLRAIPQEPPTL